MSAQRLPVVRPATVLAAPADNSDGVLRAVAEIELVAAELVVRDRHRDVRVLAVVDIDGRLAVIHPVLVDHNVGEFGNVLLQSMMPIPAWVPRGFGALPAPAVELATMVLPAIRMFLPPWTWMPSLCVPSLWAGS